MHEDEGWSPVPLWPANTHTPPPAHILTSFQVPQCQPAQLDAVWSRGWRCDRAVLSPAGDHAVAHWTGRLMTKLRPRGVAIARPIVTTDGRLSVSGWRARSFISGHQAPRFDEMAAGALRLNEACLQEPCPDFLLPMQTFTRGMNIFRAAEEAVFSDDPANIIAAVMGEDAVPRPDAADALSKALVLLRKRGEVTQPSQLVHADIAGCTIFDGASDPIVTDFVAAWRPAGWSVAVLVVDCMAWGNAPDTLIDRWRHIPDWDQLLIRAVAYRLLVHAMWSASQEESWPGLARVADVISLTVAR